MSPAIASLGAWLEQLLAESTGKGGKGLIPIDGEALAAPDVYGLDRMFVYLRLKSAPDPAQDAWADALERAGHPVVRIVLDDVYDLGEEFFRWEFATAVAGSILGVHPVRSARCRSQQDRDAQADRRLRAKRRAAGRDADLHEQRHRSLHRRHQRGDPREGRTRRAARSSRTCRAHLNRARGRRLLRAARLRRDERVEPAAAAGDSPGRRRCPSRGHLPRVRAALPALHRPGL